MKSKYALLDRCDIRVINGRWERVLEETIQVRVLARVDGYAMVRYKKAVPFICKEAELRDAKKLPTTGE